MKCLVHARTLASLGRAVKSPNVASLFAVLAGLAFGTAACSDVGDDSGAGAGSSSSGGSAADGPTFGYDRSPTHDAGGGGDTTVPGSDAGSSVSDGTAPKADGTSV